MGFLLRLLSVKCFAGIAFLLKEVNTSWDHLVHAIRVGGESPQSLSIWGKQGNKGEGNKTMNFLWK